jgi:16S rRNA (cytidine1402-2'-O)-methyltransferase
MSSSAAASKGTLYLVPNTLDHGTWSGETAPDIRDTLPARSLRIAAQLGHWVAENPKSARAFLKRVHSATALAQPLQAITIIELPRAQKGHGAPSVPPNTIDPLLAPALAGHDLGLISEAGLPAVADPGNALVLAAHRLGVPVVALSGPSSLMLALASSGLDGQCFAFVGYVPSEATERARRLKALEQVSRSLKQTQLLIETPYRNEVLLKALLEHLQPTTRLSISVGLTLPGGWSRTATVSDWRKQPGSLPSDVPAVFAFLG